MSDRSGPDEDESDRPQRGQPHGAAPRGSSPALIPAMVALGLLGLGFWALAVTTWGAVALALPMLGATILIFAVILRVTLG